MSNKTKKILTVVSGVAAVAAVGTLAFAADPSTQGSIADIISEMLGYIRDLFICIGVLLGIYSIGQLALSFKDDNPDQKSKAMTLLVCCAILIGVGSLMDTLLTTVGIDGIEVGEGFLGIGGGGGET